MTRSRLAAAIAIPILLTIGLAFTFLQGRHPAGQAAPATVAPSSSLPPPPTTNRPNPPKATGEDWLAIMSDILTYRHYLYEHPQPNLLPQIYDKRCPCFTQERNALADLQRRGWKYTDQGVKVLSAKLLGRLRQTPWSGSNESLDCCRRSGESDSATDPNRPCRESCSTETGFWSKQDGIPTSARVGRSLPGRPHWHQPAGRLRGTR